MQGQLWLCGHQGLCRQHQHQHANTTSYVMHAAHCCCDTLSRTVITKNMNHKSTCARTAVLTCISACLVVCSDHSECAGAQARLRSRYTIWTNKKAKQLSWTLGKIACTRSCLHYRLSSAYAQRPHCSYLDCTVQILCQNYDITLKALPTPCHYYTITVVLQLLCHSWLSLSVPHLCSLILESGLDLLPAFANQLRHNLLIVLPQREVGGDAAVVSSQKADCSSVICPSCIVLCVVIAHRHTGFAQGSYLHNMHSPWSDKAPP